MYFQKTLYDQLPIVYAMIAISLFGMGIIIAVLDGPMISLALVELAGFMFALSTSLVLKLRGGYTATGEP